MEFDWIAAEKLVSSSASRLPWQPNGTRLGRRTVATGPAARSAARAGAEAGRGVALHVVGDQQAARAEPGAEGEVH
ncbi:hypothetical protein [Actinoplanes sp. NPDC020271]|uniref:hypothetical protein n=1 Tax=Actinoplanes sp. NPDC020271 TaxID=3363896 RepID=UPI0037A24C29